MPDTSLSPYVNILSIDTRQFYEVNIIVLNSKLEAERSRVTYLTSPLCEAVPIPVYS